MVLTWWQLHSDGDPICNEINKQCIYNEIIDMSVQLLRFLIKISKYFDNKMFKGVIFNWTMGNISNKPVTDLLDSVDLQYNFNQLNF